MKEYIEDENLLKGFYYKSLPAVLIKDNFVKGDSFSYEDWMLEYTNLSKHFLNLSGGEKYRKPASEANKECDCISSTYELDFKRLISTSFMYGNDYFKQDSGLYEKTYTVQKLKFKQRKLVEAQKRHAIDVDTFYEVYISYDNDIDILLKQIEDIKIKNSNFDLLDNNFKREIIDKFVKEVRVHFLPKSFKVSFITR